MQLYERAAVKKIARAARAVQKEIKAGKTKDEAFNASLIDLVRASEVILSPSLPPSSATYMSHLPLLHDSSLIIIFGFIIM